MTPAEAESLLNKPVGTIEDELRIALHLLYHQSANRMKDTGLPVHGTSGMQIARDALCHAGMTVRIDP